MSLSGTRKLIVDPQWESKLKKEDALYALSENTDE